MLNTVFRKIIRTLIAGVALIALLVPAIPVNASGTVNVVMTPSSPTLTIGSSITETISIQAGSVYISAAAVSLSFDKTKLAITYVTTGASLPVVLYNSYDNDAGTFDYDAVKYGTPYPTSTFILCTVTFQALAITASTSISFVGVGSEYAPYTDVFDDSANSVINTATGATVTIVAASVPPTVTADAAANIGINNATLTGTLVDMGTPAQASVSFSFQYGTTTSYGWTTPPISLYTNGSWTENVTGLSSNTLYHFRSRGAGGTAGIGYSSDRTFTTTAYLAPIVIANPATSVSQTTATLNGNLTSLGMAAAANVSFWYGPTTSYSFSTVLQPMNTTGNFSQDIIGLFQGTTYHFMAVANYETSSYAYSNDVTFITGGIPSITTQRPVHITSSTATLQGSVDSAGSYTPIFCYFEYGPNTGLGSFTLEQTVWNAIAVSETIEGLTANTTYYFRFCARYNISQYVYGNVLTFTNLAPISPTPFLPDIPESTGWYTEGDFSKIPGAAIVNQILDDSDIPRMLWWFPFIYLGICIIGFIVYGATRINGAPGSVFLMVIVMETLIAIPAVMGATPFFPAILFPLPALAFTVKQNAFSW